MQYAVIQKLTEHSNVSQINFLDIRLYRLRKPYNILVLEYCPLFLLISSRWHMMDRRDATTDRKSAKIVGIRNYPTELTPLISERALGYLHDYLWMSLLGFLSSHNADLMNEWAGLAQPIVVRAESDGFVTIEATDKWQEREQRRAVICHLALPCTELSKKKPAISSENDMRIYPWLAARQCVGRQVSKAA